MLVFSAVTGEMWRLDWSLVSRSSLLGVAYLIVFGSIIALSAYVWLLRASTPAKVVTYAYVNPLVAVLLGHWIAGETLSIRLLLAFALIVPAVALVTITRRAVQSNARPRHHRPNSAYSPLPVPRSAQPTADEASS